MNISQLKHQIIQGYHISRKDSEILKTADLEELCGCADEIRKEYCGNSFDICTIINAKSGKCPENCKYCAQSAHYHTNISEYPLLDLNSIEKDALYNEEKGILRYSVVTSGKGLTEEEVNKLCNIYRHLTQHCSISLCASHGLLSYKQFLKLKNAGLTRYHNNLETSRRNFPFICTTHTYDDKINTIRAAQKAGLEVCSGGIMGLGETMDDRIDMAFELRKLGIRSVPINVLNPIKGTPLQSQKVLSTDEVRRIVAIYRFILPTAAIRMAGGRGLMREKGIPLFTSGANAAISGDMLTTSGITIQEDLKFIKNLGYKIEKLYTYNSR